MTEQQSPSAEKNLFGHNARQHIEGALSYVSKIKEIVMALHSYQYASKLEGWSDREDIDISVKLGTTMAIALPPPALAVVLSMVLAPQIGPGQFKVFLVISVLVSIFGLSFFTDRIHDRHASYIKELAAEIVDDPERGRNWARRRLAVIFLIQIASIVVLALLGRVYVVYGTDLPLIAM